MAVSFVSAATAVETDSIPLSSHQAGDLIIVLAGGITGTAIVVPAGWFVIGIRVAAPRNLVMAGKHAASSSEVSGTWTNAVIMASTVYRDTSNMVGVGGPTLGAATTTSITYNAIVAKSDGGSAAGKAPLDLVLPIAGGQIASNTIGIDSLPPGYTFRSGKSHSTEATAIALFDAVTEVASITAQITTIATSTLWATIVSSLFNSGYAKSSGGGSGESSRVFIG